MRFLHKEDEEKELTYEDVFLLPQYSDIRSRMDVDITPPDGTGATIPIVVANMTSAAGKRMAETVTRRGGLVVLTQDTHLDRIEEVVKYLKSRHPIIETPVTLEESESIQTALNLINKRAHGAIVVTNEKGEPTGIFTERDAEGRDKFSILRDVMTHNIISGDDSITPREAFDKLNESHISVLPIIKKSGELIGIITKKGAVRSEFYKPALNKDGQFVTAVAIGTNDNAVERAKALKDMNVDIIAIDTAHGHSKRLLETVRRVRDAVGEDIIIHAAQVATGKAVEDVIDAGADIVNVGIGAGGSCTTRIMTASGRPQLSAVIECAKSARKKGKHVWADSRIREPRDLALALASGATSTMFGTILAGTYESPGDIQFDEYGKPYKISIGMASTSAVNDKFKHLDEFDLAKKQYFQEGTNNGRIYLKEGLSGVEDIIDRLISGLRSALSYTGACNLEEFHEKAIMGVQTQAGFSESNPLKQN
ncbi:GuaB1 family IMP dehydrogenase-related protein [Patescibacteria group bacterium]|nr:GuaB1 family IMP dehydrogenase-related protein [Patescibacteria group bacterium]